jgi:hypothetical protein
VTQSSGHHLQQLAAEEVQLATMMIAALKKRVGR